MRGGLRLSTTSAHQALITSSEAYMTKNPYQAPTSDLTEKGKPLPVEIKTPRVVYFIAIFLFLIFGANIKIIQKTFLLGIPPASLVEVAILLTFTGLPVAVAFFDRTALIIASVVMGLMAISLTYRLGLAIYSSTVNPLMMTATTVIIILLCYCAWYCSRKKTLDLAAMNGSYKNHIALTKDIQKRLRKR